MRRSSFPRRRLGLATRSLAASMALVAILGLRTASSDPGDIFTQAAPLVTDAPPKSTPTLAGDASVSPTGSLEYSYPISLPPGRHGMQPHLALHYSSTGAIYGGIAAGWSLDIPMITLDTTRGRLWSTAFSLPVKNYRVSIGQQQLIVSPETAADGASAYRGIHDASFTRYERMPSGSAYQWRAYTTDGNVMYFGDTDHASCTSNGVSMISDEYAPLTRTSDPFGNVVEYFYGQGVDGECRINLIQWGQNAAAGIAPFASVSFVYNSTPPTCAALPIGSQSSYRTGTRIVTGASELDQIVIKAYAPGSETTDHTRQITLTYDAAAANLNGGSTCTTASNHAAYRSLVSIQESAWGVDSPQVDLPAVTFGYGPMYSYPGATGHSLGWATSDLHTANLGWGYLSPSGGGDWPTVEAMMVDVDGDGLLDRLVNAPLRDPQHQNSPIKCQAAWYKNHGNFNFDSDPTGFIPLPTLKWGSQQGQGQYDGGPYGRDEFSSGGERCALNYQQTLYYNSQTGTLPCPVGDASGCPLTQPTCSNHNDCVAKPAAFPTVLAYRWMDVDGDGRIDLVVSPAKASLNTYNLIQGNGVLGTNAPVEPLAFGSTWPACPAASYTVDSSGGYTMCGGMYPWAVYLNHGAGKFGLDDQLLNVHYADKIVYQPMPLETSNGDSSLTSFPVGQYQGMLDIDGDGVADAVYQTANAANWQIYRGDRTNMAFGPSSGNLPFVFTMPPNAYLNFTQYEQPDAFGNVYPTQTMGLLDLNGDGLLDRWHGVDENDVSEITTIDINDGTQFRSAEATFLIRPTTTGVELVTGYSGTKPFSTSLGNRQDRRRMLDVDNDGRPDLVTDAGSWPTSTLQCPNNTPPPAQLTYFNQGGQFGTSMTVPLFEQAVAHSIKAGNSIWEIRSDMLDLDGDGIPEGIDFGMCTASLQMSIVPTPTQPPRLLVSIDSNRGASTAISYASVASGAVVPPDITDIATMPHTRWVVQSMTTTDQFANTTPTIATTSYKYMNPRWLPDDQGTYALRGFDEIDTTMPSGAMRVDRYGFDVDFSGRIVQSIVHPSEAPSEARTIDDTSWEARTLFAPNNTVTTYHAIVQQHRTCKNGQTETTCTPTTAAAYTRTTHTLSACGSTDLCDGGNDIFRSSPVLWIETRSLLSTDPNGNDVDGDRETLSAYAVYADAATNYRVRPVTTTHNSRVAGTMVMYGKTAQTWDAAFATPVKDEVWVDNNDANRAITFRVYDTLGNVIARQKPVQYDAHTTQLVNTYDARKLFVATEVDEKGLQRDYTYEYGTGTKLVTAGPNVRTCTQNCPNDNLHPLKETHQIRVDGLGRQIESWATLGNDGGIYTLTQMGTTSYVDTATPTTPTSVTDYRFITYDSPTQTQQKTELDGHGRPIRKTVYVQGSAPADQVTSFHYRNDGTLQEVTVPDPTANDATTVTYTYGFDSLGRPTSIRRPDSTTNPSGIDLSYDGVTKTATEVVGASGGQIAITQTKTDAFGRLSEVDEQLVDNPLTWATTTYSYGPDDNVTQIVDPEGITTQLQHDFAGHRTAIIRGGRTWSYTYDKNGNMTVEQVPGATGPLDDINYTQTMAYDDLDRPASRVNGARTLSSADQQLFGIDHETFTWDYVGGNRKGHLVFWTAYAPGSSTPQTSSTYSYDALGNQTATTHYMAIAGFPSLTRQIVHYTNLLGAPWIMQYGDGDVDGVNHTTGRIYFDARGLPQKYVLLRTGMPNQDVGVQTRNVAGLVTKRRTDLSGAMTFVESNWTYDKLGRVASQVVQQGPGPTQVARQDLAYFGNDDPSTLDDWLGPTNHKQFHYTFDLRHQLLGVTETAQGGVFGATYTFGDAGRFTTALETSASLPNSDVKPRSVSYVYGDANDRERVTALTNTVDGTTYAGYSYDEAGNTISRSYPATGDSWDFVYDGRDQLRRATKKHDNVVVGSEEYWYDGGSNRRMAVVKRDAAGNKTELIWFIGDTEAHYDGAGNLVHVYSHLSLGTPVARVDRTGNSSTNLEFQFHGLANNTLAAVDQGGTINASFSYAPFGEIVEATDAGSGVGAGVLAHRRRMNDKYGDEITTNAYYGARFYDQTTMLWTQADTLSRLLPEHSMSQPRRTYLYAFDNSNPLRYIDPDGMDSKSQLSVVIQDVSNLNRDEQINTRMINLVSQTIAESFRPKSGNHGDALIQTASQGKTTAHVSSTSKVGDTNSKGITFILANLMDLRSVTNAKNSGGKLEVDTLLANRSGAAASQEGGGTKTVIALNRLLEALVAKHLDINDDRDIARIKSLIEIIVVHEAGHDLGMCHEDPCGSDKKRSHNEVMEGDAELDPDVNIFWRQSDLDRMKAQIDKRAY